MSLSPTATEMLFAIGAGGQVVAVDSNSSYPAEAPKTDLSAYQPNIEAIAGYKFDLVVYLDDPGAEGRAGKLSIPLLHQPAATRPGRHLRPARLGRPGHGHADEAGRVAAAMRAEIAKIAAAARPERPLTYYHELDKNLYTATSKTFIGQLYGQLGMKNIADAADKDGTGYPQLSAEYVIKADPDLIFLADTKCCGQSARTVAARDGWDELTAVRTGGVVELDDDVALPLGTAGGRLPEDGGGQGRDRGGGRGRDPGRSAGGRLRRPWPGRPWRPSWPVRSGWPPAPSSSWPGGCPSSTPTPA